MAYTYTDLLNAYEKIGIKPGALLCVFSDLRLLMRYDGSARKAVKAHVDALREVVGPQGTIVMPSSCVNLCNTDEVFDPNTTPSQDVGILAEYFRTLQDSTRSFHPFVSVSAAGPIANEITENVSRHAFGPEAPMDRLLKHDAVVVSIGMEPRNTATAVHHVEHVMSVPYRYTKEFMHPVMRNGEVSVEPFYRHVIYRGIDVERDKNQKLFERIGGDLDIKEAVVGGGKVYSYSMRRFFDLATHEFARDMYIWCKSPPEKRPYRD